MLGLCLLHILPGGEILSFPYFKSGPWKGTKL